MKRLFFVIFILFHSFQVVAQSQKGPNKLYPILFNYARNLFPEYDKIPFERRVVLEEIAKYILGSTQFEGKSEIIFVGSNNATRSILTEAWANAAAYYYGLENIHIYSGGVTGSEVSPFGIMALEKAGFIIYRSDINGSIRYEIKYTYNKKPNLIYSKEYKSKDNPNFNFGSIVICANADINIPVIKGSNFRTSLHYFDPVAYDDDPDVFEKYLERSKEIATEMFYLFYLLKSLN